MNRVSRRCSVVVIGLSAAMFTIAPSALAVGTGASRGVFEAANGSLAKIWAKTTPSELVVDHQGTQHLVTTLRKSDTDTRIVYLTRKQGAGHWTSHQIRGARPTSPDFNIGVEAHLNTTGTRLFAVFYQCDGVYVSAAPISATRLPKPSLVLKATDPDACQDSGDGHGALTLTQPEQWAVSLGVRTVGILLTAADGGSTAVWTGKPGGTFAPGPALPTGHGFRAPFTISRETTTGRLVVTGQAQAGSVDNAKSADVVDVTTLGKGATAWSPLTRIASLHSVVKDYDVSSQASSTTSTYIALESTNGRTVYLVSSTAAGGWSKPVVVRHSKSGINVELTLAVNSRTSTLHAAWQHWANTSRSGASVRLSTLGKNGWSTPTGFRDQADDRLAQLELKPAGHPVVVLARVPFTH